MIVVFSESIQQSVSTLCLSRSTLSHLQTDALAAMSLLGPLRESPKTLVPVSGCCFVLVTRCKYSYTSKRIKQACLQFHEIMHPHTNFNQQKTRRGGLDGSQVMGRMIGLGNMLGDDAEQLLAEWNAKSPLLPKPLVWEYLGLGVRLWSCMYIHRRPSAADRARGVAYIVNLSSIGVACLAALRADNGDGEAVKRFVCWANGAHGWFSLRRLLICSEIWLRHGPKRARYRLRMLWRQARGLSPHDSSVSPDTPSRPTSS